jgi:diguanylate cyclase (GGDEF)-like protein/PAS domain S-box-containing protein
LHNEISFLPHRYSDIKSSMPDENHMYRDLLDNLADGVYFTNSEGRITYWNKGAERLSGFGAAEVLGKHCSDSILIHVDCKGISLCTSQCPLRKTIQDGQAREEDAYLHHKSGSRMPIHLRVSPLRDQSGTILGAVEVFSDNTAKAQMAERLAQMEQLALLDPLTNLPNRRYMESHLHSHLEAFRRNGWGFGLLYADIDDFKLVNDSLGHGTGDRVLKMVAGTLDANSRFFDIVGRWGGDEFVAVIHNVDDKSFQDIAERLRVLVEQSALPERGAIHVTISIGGAQARRQDTASSILQRADANLYRAKNSGKNRIWIE